MVDLIVGAHNYCKCVVYGRCIEADHGLKLHRLDGYFDPWFFAIKMENHHNSSKRFFFETYQRLTMHHWYSWFITSWNSWKGIFLGTPGTPIQNFFGTGSKIAASPCAKNFCESWHMVMLSSVNLGNLVGDEWIENGPIVSNLALR